MAFKQTSDLSLNPYQDTAVPLNVTSLLENSTIWLELYYF